MSSTSYDHDNSKPPTGTIGFYSSSGRFLPLAVELLSALYQDLRINLVFCPLKNAGQISSLGGDKPSKGMRIDIAREVHHPLLHLFDTHFFVFNYS